MMSRILLLFLCHVFYRWVHIFWHVIFLIISTAHKNSLNKYDRKSPWLAGDAPKYYLYTMKDECCLLLVIHFTFDIDILLSQCYLSSFLTNSYIDVWIIWKSVAIFQMDLTELHLVCCFTFLMISFIFYDLGKLGLGFLETVQALFNLVLIL